MRATREHERRAAHPTGGVIEFALAVGWTSCGLGGGAGLSLAKWDAYMGEAWAEYISGRTRLTGRHCCKAGFVGVEKVVAVRYGLWMPRRRGSKSKGKRGGRRGRRGR